MSWRNQALCFFLRNFIKPRVSWVLSDIVKARRWLEYRAKFASLLRPPKNYIRQELPNGNEWLIPAKLKNVNEAKRTILYLHGGAYLFFSPRTHRGIAARLAEFSDAAVLSLNYRLAPEHPFPAAVNDAYQAYCQLIDAGTPASSIVLAGDSAGAGLVLATLIALRDASGELALPAAAVCFSPWADLTQSHINTSSTNHDDVTFSQENIIQAAQYYLANTPANHPQISPVFDCLNGLPAILLQVSDQELLLKDARHLEKKICLAGGIVNLQLWHGVPHAWQAYTPGLPEAKFALQAAAEFIKHYCPE